MVFEVFMEVRRERASDGYVSMWRHRRSNRRDFVWILMVMGFFGESTPICLLDGCLIQEECLLDWMGYVRVVIATVAAIDLQL